jgi:hypothetical protein
LEFRQVDLVVGAAARAAIAADFPVVAAHRAVSAGVPVAAANSG